uniref:putative nuclease HARBI1 n=1 Tax=Osmia lignaria TaxID=473952 RepID=UPI0014783BF5|nr:putative nuclease HARBI1 [Osmia lignaria]
MQTPARNRRELRSQLRRAVLAAIEVCREVIQEEIDHLEENTHRPWVRQWISQRRVAGASAVLLRELSVENAHEYRNHLRLSPNQLEQLLTSVFRIPKSTFSMLLPEVCDAIFNVLKEFIKVPSGPAEWRQIAQGFEERWNFPGCCGAIDGKHITIQAPPNSGTQFYNYRGTNSLVLLAVADHESRFLYIDIGRNGVMSDGGVFGSSALHPALEGGMLPEGHCFVGDDAFPLKPYLLKLYKGTQLSRGQKIFNYRLSRARRTVESAFGILASRFRILYTRIPCALSTVDKIVMACCALHNWLRSTNEEIPPPPAPPAEAAEVPLPFAAPSLDTASAAARLFRIQDCLQISKWLGTEQLLISKQVAIQLDFVLDIVIPPRLRLWSESKCCNDGRGDSKFYDWAARLSPRLAFVVKEGRKREG